MRGRSGGVLPGVAPANAYPTADGHDVVIAANADAVFARLARRDGPARVGDRPALRDARGARRAPGRARRRDRAVDGARSPSTDVLARLRAHAVPVGLINTAPDLAIDDHIAAREMIVRLAAGFERAVPMAGVVPKLSRTPGAIRTVGPELGEHTDVVLRELAGLADAEIAAFRDAGVVA